MTCPSGTPHERAIFRIPVVRALSGRGHTVQVAQIAEAIVDAADAPLVAHRRWHLNRELDAHPYVRSSPVKRAGERGWFYLHRLILGLEDPKIEGEHINGNSLDNRRCNLRPATRAQNARNVRARSTRWPYKGIDYFAPVDAFAEYPRYRARLYVHGRYYQLGPFDSMEEAAAAYDALARDAYGDFAWLNFPQGVAHAAA